MVKNMGVTYEKLTKQNRVLLTASVHMCPNAGCRGLMFIICNPFGEVLTVQPPELIDFDPNGIPERCKRTIEEAVACHAAGAHRAATMMVRRLLEEICEENNAAGKTLHDRLQALRNSVVLPEALFDAMLELKVLGNDAAHVEARAYDNIARDEAADSIELAKEILKSLYQLKGLVERLQARKKAQGQPTTP